MIAPEPADGINPQTVPAARLPWYSVVLRALASSALERGPLRPLLLRALAYSAMIFTLLQAWRPYFFLTDDNLDGGFPFFTEVGRNLLAGRSPFVSHHLFGGNYNLLRDATFFSWHPVYLLISLLEATPLRLGIIDADAFFMLMLATAGFVTLAHHLRRTMPLSISDRWITFYALSYTYTMIALTTGASWLSFLGDVASLPWLALGIVQKTWSRGIPVVVLFTLNEMLGGHLEPAISNSVFLSLFALGLCIARRSLLPMVNWLGGGTIALILLLPVLLPALQGFSHSLRSGGLRLEDMQQNNIPAVDFLNSIFLGMASWIFYPHGHPYVTYNLALGSSAAVWCLLPALVPELAFRARQIVNLVQGRHLPGGPRKITPPAKLKWRGTTLVTLLMVIFGAVMIVRPFLITEIMARVPLLNAMRWPFREFIQFQFFLHLFLVVRSPGMTGPVRKYSAVFGTFVYVVPLVLYPFAPTFNTMNWDRELIISGRYQEYWAQVNALLKPGDRVAVIIPFDLYQDDRFEEPYCLLGSYNYATLDGFVNAWGYSPTAPLDQVYTKTYAFYPFGAYHPQQKAALEAEKPDLKFITLESLQPLRITLSSRDGPTIDLTPFVPPRESKIPKHEHGLP